ncbi:50S ribosomal protein L35 [Patescibacteria group bacterium]|nr:50S ribosomal protein L35 [Patescibacteria group bacterium]
MKLKSRSSVKKRVKVTGTKKLVMQKSCKRHLLANKSKRQKKLDNKGKMVEPSNVRKLKKMLPHCV